MKITDEKDLKIIREALIQYSRTMEVKERTSTPKEKKECEETGSRIENLLAEIHFAFSGRKP